MGWPHDDIELEAQVRDVDPSATGSMTPPVVIELIARAVVRRGDMVLVAHAKGANSVFLPGGHVEPGEPIEQALRRELREELGVVEAEIGALRGVVEHAYTDDDDAAHHEVNFVFDVTIADTALTSCEAHIEFAWIPIVDVDDAGLLPAAVRPLVRMSVAVGPVWLPWRPR